MAERHRSLRSSWSFGGCPGGGAAGGCGCLQTGGIAANVAGCRFGAGGGASGDAGGGSRFAALAAGQACEAAEAATKVCSDRINFSLSLSLSLSPKPRV